ncbi:MAG: hypothetical protein M8860_03285 [marine benthic group bacterium]|jgi:hypothetical protein|nr:hypothetical protein [Gemmatimonadota bacterium]MCL7961862.1 hypothetical protein [Candidatus Carthagonibacter metallireducens]MCL7966453.1 hypothetical protein [Gemmatimonadota bacterium]MCL7968361.1 hypothetical protein [Gemmatimonadota bacterium]MCL7984401.1 hypothetical protein [Gemmatimonadota bacterium]
MKNSQRVLALMGLVGILVAQTGCTSYQRIEPSAIPLNGQVRITTTEGKQMELTQARLTSDMLEGLLEDGSVIHIPVQAVGEMEAPEFDNLKTGALFIGVVGAVVAVAVGGIYALCYDEDC